MKKNISKLLLCLFLAVGVTSRVLAAGSPQDMDSYERVRFESLQKAGVFSKKGKKIDGYLLKADTKGKSPVAILRPACNGLLMPKKGAIRLYHRDIAEVLQKAGIATFMVDGFSPRKRKNICTTPPKDRAITMDVRIKDTIGALRYLQTRNDIDSSKIFLLTYGAIGGFHMMSDKSHYSKEVDRGFAGAVMFFPQCNEAARTFAPFAPIQVFVGEKDAWNPPSHCRKLAKRKTPDSAPFNLKVYPDTYHAFVKRSPPREVQGPPGVGRVTTGGNPQSTADAYKVMTEFLTRLVQAPSGK